MPYSSNTEGSTESDFTCGPESPILYTISLVMCRVVMCMMIMCIMVMCMMLMCMMVQLKGTPPYVALCCTDVGPLDYY